MNAFFFVWHLSRALICGSGPCNIEVELDFLAPTKIIMGLNLYFRGVKNKGFSQWFTVQQASGSPKSSPSLLFSSSSRICHTEEVTITVEEEGSTTTMEVTTIMFITTGLESEWAPLLECTMAEDLIGKTCMCLF